MREATVWEQQGPYSATLGSSVDYAIYNELGNGIHDAFCTKSAISFVLNFKSSTSKTPSANLRKKRGIPFSSTLPRGLRIEALVILNIPAMGIKSFLLHTF